MIEADLPRLVAWFREPHVLRWWYVALDLEQTRAKYMPRIAGTEPVHMLIASEDTAPIGFAQWYGWDGDEDRAQYPTIGPGDLGIDYTIGEPSAIGRGLGTELVAGLLDLLRAKYAAGTPVSVTPNADNPASRRILERNGFAFVALAEFAGAAMAHYRRAL